MGFCPIQDDRHIKLGVGIRYEFSKWVAKMFIKISLHAEMHYSDIWKKNKQRYRTPPCKNNF